MRHYRAGNARLFGARRIAPCVRFLAEKARQFAGAGALVVGLLAMPFVAHATVVTYDLAFETSGQSIWNTGASTTLDQTTFLGAAWQDKSIDIDLMAGDASTNVINPLRVTYDLAFAACTGLGFSSSACINGQSARAYVPALGSRPSIRSCGKWAVGCKIARAGDYTRRAAYDTALAACKLGFSTSVCKNGQSARVPVIALGSAPAQYLNIDTRTGAIVTGTTDGRVGLELGIQIDSGSVDATVSYEASLDIPDTSGATTATGALISFNPTSQLAGVNTLDTSFANLELTVDAVMELSGSVTAEACSITAANCATGSTPFDIDETAPILSFNDNGEGAIELLGRSPSAFGLPPEANGFPFELPVADLATVTLHLPQPDATGGLDTTTNTLKAHGQDDLVDLILDVDNIVATAAGVPGLFGGDLPSLKIGNLEVGSFGFDIINVGMGPTIDLVQDFELNPTLYVNLSFDEDVEIAGQLVDEITSAWDLLPDIKFLSGLTTVTPTFFLDVDLLNQTLLDFDLDFIIDLLQITYDFPLLNLDGKLGIGNVLSQGVDLFSSPNLYEKLFDLQGFNLQIGESFAIALGADSTLPASRAAFSAVNQIVLAEIPADADVPEAGTVFLFLAGFGVLFLVRRNGEFRRGIVRTAFAGYSRPLA